MCDEYVDEDEVAVGGISELEDVGGWSRSFLDEVAAARQAVERADKLLEWRKQKAYGLPAHIDTDVPAYVDAQNEQKSAYAWAEEVLQSFDELASVQRESLRGELLEGLDIAEAKYRLGMKNRAITSDFHIGNDTMYRRLAAFTEYLDYLGPEQAFSVVDIKNNPVGFGFEEPTQKCYSEQLDEAGIMPSPEEWARDYVN